MFIAACQQTQQLFVCSAVFVSVWIYIIICRQIKHSHGFAEERKAWAALDAPGHPNMGMTRRAFQQAYGIIGDNTEIESVFPTMKTLGGKDQ